MTKTEMKKRKRKNVVMRRTIRRTVAALIMIMAIVVAAIPVEQFGTMQAAIDTPKSADLAGLYREYADNTAMDYSTTNITDVTSYSQSSSGQVETKIMTQVNSNPETYKMDTQFKVVPRTTGSQEYIIVSYNTALGGGELSIGENLATNYFTINNKFLNELKSILATEHYKVSFLYEQTGQSVTITYKDGANTQTGTFSYPSNIKTTTPDFTTNTDRKENSFTVGSQTYSLTNGLTTGLDDEVIFTTEDYAKGSFDARIAQINTYNTNLNQLKNNIASAQANPNLSLTEYNNLKQEADSLTTQFNNYKELTVTTADIKNLDAYINDSIIKRVYFTYNTTSKFNLLGFKLVKMTDPDHTAGTDEEMVWTPLWPASNGNIADYDKLNSNNAASERASHVDDNGFIVLGDVITATGIGNEAFKNVDVPFSLNLSSKIEFIGKDAFNGCSRLQAVNLAYCKAVGDRAFKGCTSLNTVSFGSEASPTKAGVLGTEAFYGCNQLREVSFPNGLTEIGPGCFANSGVQTVTFNDNNSKGKMIIWPFAFFNCQELTNLTLPNVTSYHDFEIGLGAFALDGVSDTGRMSSFNFPEGMTKIIVNKADDAHFKLTGTILSSHRLPTQSSNDAGEIYYDYILAGRTALKYVTFPGTMNTTKIPDNTLMKCYNLECVTFGKCSENDLDCDGVTFDSPDLKDGIEGQYDHDKDKEYLFQDIANPAFYVQGPGFTNTGAVASTRKCTAASQTQVRDYVPYKYMQDGQMLIEMSYGKDNEYVAVVVIDDTNKTGTLKSFERLDPSKNSDIRELVIPDKIGEYTITKLGEGCFGNIVDKVIELTIEDATVSELEAGAFEGADKLLQVNIGNSVTKIGENAFKDCKNLENVYFSSHTGVGDDGWESLMTIGNDAFKTNSKYLTFHGEIHSGYAPFELAMSNKAFNDGTNGADRICYRTDEPQNLTVIWDKSTNMATLMDYPHYEEIDAINQFGLLKQKIKNTGNSNYSIKKKFEVYQGWTTDSNYNGSLDEDERSVVMNSLMVNIPDGIDSIDAQKFFKSEKNRNNFAYLNRYYDEKEDLDSGNVLNTIEGKTITRKINANISFGDVQKLYSVDDYGTSLGTEKAGLFSGLFEEEGTGIIGKILSITDSPETNNKEYTEDNKRGNDNLTTVTLNSVEYLPPYAFDSCENLLSVDIGEGLYDIGKMPFKNCSSLNSVTTNRNSNYLCENSILYAKGNTATTFAADSRASTGGDTIVECLEPRGGETSPYSPQIKIENDPNLANVTKIAEEAFSNAPYITDVDLTGTRIEEIPDGCFRDAKRLMSVTMPKSVRSFGEDVFEGCTSLNSVFIYNPSCSINGAFGDTQFKGTVYGPAYVDQDNTEPSAIKNYCDSHNIKFESLGYVLKFYDYDHTVVDVQNIEPGKAGTSANGSNPEWKPNRSGYKFAGWECKLSDGTVLKNEQTYQNVKENRTIYAVYEPDGSGMGDGKSYTLTIVGGKDSTGKTSLSVSSGSAIAIVADTTSGKTFQYWTAKGSAKDENGKDVTKDYATQVGDIHSAITTLVMPTGDVTLTANFTDGSSGSNSGNSGNSGSNSGNSGGSTTTDTTTKYKLTVNYGSGSGDYAAGTIVSISAYAPDSSTKVFSKWTTTNSGVGFASATSSSTTFTMPASAVTVTANYKTRSDDDEDDDKDAAARRKGSTTTATTTTVAAGTNNAANTTNTVGNATNTAATATQTAQGDRLSIDKTGISNKEVGSTSVEGATDNFVVKISDSDSAVTEAQKALMNKFGSLDGIVYFPMDISLYDASGKNKIEDTTGLNVTVTVPIPDEMIQYGGNVHVAAIENGQLEDLNVRFTTIDGIACMSFVPPHFSPYVAYVDTQNLTAGQMLDATPKTGDPIHPKWFLAAGMACLSIILFTTGDKKRRIKIA